MLQLLETVPQDIKSSRDYKPCAPEFFRWVVVGGYAAVLLSALVCGLFVLREKQQNTLAEKDQQRLADINQKIAAIQDKGSQSQAVRMRYEDWKSWLKGNYTLSSFLAQLYTALPEGARVQELTLDEQAGRPGAFAVKIRFFSQGENRMANTQDFEDKLQAIGVELQNRQESVAEGGKTEVAATIVLPQAYYPQGNKLAQALKKPATPPTNLGVAEPVRARADNMKKGGAK